MIYPQVGEPALKIFEKNITGTLKLDLIKTFQVVDVRDRGDIKRKEEELQNIYKAGKQLVHTG